MKLKHTAQTYLVAYAVATVAFARRELLRTEFAVAHTSRCLGLNSVRKKVPPLPSSAQ